MILLEDTARQIAISGAAFAGFTLVFFGNSVASFAQYDNVSKDTVRKYFLIQTGISLAGFLVAVFSVAAAITFSFFPYDCLVYGSAYGLSVSAVLVIIAALVAYLDVLRV